MMSIVISIISVISIIDEIETNVDGDVVGVYKEGIVDVHNTDRGVRTDNDKNCFRTGSVINGWLTGM
jgi:hypothetical protein